MRLSTLPKLQVAIQQPSIMTQNYEDYTESPQSAYSTHSRDSSNSENYSPVTQTFSIHEPTRDSTSSLGTTPPIRDQSFENSPRASKTTLDDLVEVPGEREGDHDPWGLALTTSQCQCASPFCMRQCASTSALDRPSLDYSLADGFSSDSEGPLRLAKVRRAAGDSPVGKLANRIGSRLPNLSLRQRAPSIPPVRMPSVRSSPTSRVPSRTNSFRMPSRNPSFAATPFAAHFEDQDQDGHQIPGISSPPGTPLRAEMGHEPREPVLPSTIIPIQSPMAEEPIDRKALASTPLLPSPMLERRISDHKVQSPLQSPTVADSPVFSFTGMSPASTPVLPSYATPPLSTKPSFASFGAMQSSQTLPLPDNSLAALRIENKWSGKLGHANFVVYPAPYMPEHCDSTSCKRLVEDWEEARKQFINHAARTSEHYGQTSHVYKLTEQKWAEIDALWRSNHESAVGQAKKAERPGGESPHEMERDYQPLAEPVSLSKLPSLNDPDNTGKFPQLEDGDIVGPMVQYAQINTQASKRTAVLKFFKDLRFSSNTLGARH